MVAIYLNRRLADEPRREAVFAGDLFLHTDLAGTKALCAHAKAMIDEAFAGFDPERAQFAMDVPEFVRRVGPLKSGFTNGHRTKELVRELVAELGADPEMTYFDVPRLRVVPSDDYLSAGVSYAYKAHRDTWYAHPTQLVNFWMPVVPVVGANAMSVFPRYFGRPVANASEVFDYDDWVANARFQASKLQKTDERPHPLPKEVIDPEGEFRIAGGVGDVMLFSTCHLHATAPNVSGVTRFSIDLRTVHADDLRAGRGPRNLDSAATGTTLGDFLRVADFAPFDLARFRPAREAAA